MARRRLEPDGGARAWAKLAAGEAIGRDPRVLEDGLIVIEVGLVLEFEPDGICAVGGGIGDDHRVMLVLIPSLEVDLVVGASRLDQTDNLGVIRNAELEIRHPHLDMGQTQHAHLRSVPWVAAHVCTFMNRSLRSPS